MNKTRMAHMYHQVRLVLNSRDRQENIWLPQKCIYKTTLQQYSLQNTALKSIGTMLLAP